MKKALNKNLSEQELACSFNIVLDKEIRERIRKIQNDLVEKFSEKRFYDSSPHAAICTKFMGISKTKDFVEVIQKEFKNDKIWELELSTFVPSDQGTYIFLNFSKKSVDKIFELNKRAIESTKGIGFEVQHGEDKPKYPYFPHISIIKLEDHEVTEAINLIRDDLNGLKMPVRKYEIMVQKDNKKGFAHFPTIREINL